MPAPFVIPTPKLGPFVLGPDSQRQPGVPQGVVTKAEWRSAIFPGTVRDYWVYVPTQYKPDQAANVIIFQDGDYFVSEDGKYRAPIVLDNLIHQGRMPVTIGIFISAGNFPAATGKPELISNRMFEYTTLGDQYVRFLLEEILPEVGAKYRLTDKASERAVCGSSAGGICSWTVAWERPDMFSKVVSFIGAFVDVNGGHVYPYLIRKAPRKPIRIFLQDGSNDLDLAWGNFSLANLSMAAALQFAGYDYRLEYGDGGHELSHCGAILPEALAWLWR